MPVTTFPFGNTRCGTAVRKHTCINASGNSIELIDYGATLKAVNMPDRDGEIANVVLGCDSIEQYEETTTYFGSIVGRVCNRIAKGKFSIDGVEHQLATNDGPNHLHGGIKGFDKKVWDSETIEESDAVGVRFMVLSPDGDEGYPGNLSVVTEYRLDDKNQLTITFDATTDAATHLNLTNHAYWNLAGSTANTVFDHHLEINAERYLLNDETLIPTGALGPVANTAFDFLTSKPIGRDLPTLTNHPIGYDNCYVIKQSDGSLRNAANVFDPSTGRQMEILTTQPGVQFYTGNYLDGGPRTGGYAQHTGFCLETQHFPDAANQPGFASTLLSPGERHQQTTVHRFGLVT
jgi:aldose 1-epimerase